MHKFGFEDTHYKVSILINYQIKYLEKFTKILINKVRKKWLLSLSIKNSFFFIIKYEGFYFIYKTKIH